LKNDLGEETFVKRKIIMISAILLALFVASVGVAGYNRDVVVAAMHSNAQNLGTVKKSLEGGDYFATAQALMAIAVTEHSLLQQDPPKGSKAEWDRIHGEVLKAALRGIGACAEEDMNAVNSHVGTIGSLIKEGHSTFRKQ
jgi:cytochrome c556